MSNVSTNPSNVEFPRDVYGFTSALRKYGLQAARGIRGNKEKHDVFMQTLSILAQHAVARFEEDAEAVAKRVAEIANTPYRTQAGTVVDPETATSDEPEASDETVTETTETTENSASGSENEQKGE